jgi:uncharacterized protein (UPF0548 family)
MFSIRKPSAEVLGSFLAEQARLEFSYPFVGQTAASPPAGFKVDRTRQKLGSGEAVFTAARRALERWEQFRLDRLELWPRETPIRTGEVVAVVARICGVWWLNACRIVYTIDAAGPVRRFGFAYGTLPDHAETGEERFSIEWDQSDDSVWYDILAFSRTRHPLARLGYPFARLTQRRFARGSAAAMVRAV